MPRRRPVERDSGPSSTRNLLCQPVVLFAAEAEVLARVADAEPAARQLTTLEDHFDPRLFWVMPTLGEAWNVEIDDEPPASDTPFTLERAELAARTNEADD